jgi:hypothetical protein
MYTGTTTASDQWDEVANRKRKFLCGLKKSFGEVNKANQDFIPSMVKISPFGTERDKGFHIFKHW